MATLAPAPSSAKAPPGPLSRRVPGSALFAGLTGWLCYDLLLLCRFLGMDMPVVATLWVALTTAIFWLATLPRRNDIASGPTVAQLLICLAIAFLLMALGGQGRFFYANLDWQVRDAVLHDMVVHPWPFVYASGDLLRAPIGMYLVPALAGKAWGQAGADVALLLQNGMLLGMIMAIAGTMFRGISRKTTALIVFLMFSGLDIIGQIRTGHMAELVPTAHIEGWGPTQYSSTITLAFWVPQHAIAGWAGGLGVMLWRDGRLRLGSLMMLAPLLALWSPLAAMGLLPFLAYALWHDLARRWIRPTDIVLPALATTAALPALAYLSAAGDAVGVRLFPIAPDAYLAFLSIEIFPFLLIALRGRHARFGGPLLGIAIVSLLVMPLVQVGWSIDFAMRASIPALTILALHLGDGLGGGWKLTTGYRAALIALLVLGSATGLTEITRALIFPLSPAPRCGFSRAWDETFSAWPKSSYLAPLDQLPEVIRPSHVRRAPSDMLGSCFPYGWARPALF